MAITPTASFAPPLKMMSKEEIRALEQEVNTALKNGTLKPKRLEECATWSKGPSLPSYQDRYEGKSIVENKNPSGIYVIERYTPDGQYIYTANDANKSAAAGAPTHGFFYQETDFLMDAAKEYAKLGENEVFRYRNIKDSGFLRDAVSFFSGKEYSSAEMYALENQMTNVVFELAQQMKNGESPDLTKVQSKLTIDGVDFTISQLFDFQKVGGELKEAFSDITVGQLDIQRYGKMGLAKSLADYYGSDKGEAGAMFSSAMGRLYEKGVAIVDELAARPNYGPTSPVTAYDRSIMSTASAIRDSLSTLDTSSKESFSQSFSNQLASMRTMVQSHCNRFNVPISQAGLASGTAELMQYFSSMLNKM